MGAVDRDSEDAVASVRQRRQGLVAEVGPGTGEPGHPVTEF